MTESKAMILGLRGPEILPEERSFFEAERPWGFILFSRNIVDADQLRALTAGLRSIAGDGPLPIFIDQEGGRVQRLRQPFAPNYPPGARLGDIYRQDRQSGLRAAWLLSRIHAFDLNRFGINADCLPVLDIPVPGSHDVIGDRAYGTDPVTVAEMGEAAMQGLLAGGVLPVIKHIPGHGRSRGDSHLELPVVDESLEELEATDFKPFAALNRAPMAMTAHVVYRAIDPAHPATTSKKVIADIIRGQMGFDGLLMSDDVSMKALAGSFADRTRAIFAAGCDVALHCNGDMDEMAAVAAETPLLEGRPLERAKAALEGLSYRDDADERAIRDEFEGLTQAVA
jgi:beta-N-acetylhexosaminidase